MVLVVSTHGDEVRPRLQFQAGTKLSTRVGVPCSHEWKLSSGHVLLKTVAAASLPSLHNRSHVFVRRRGHFDANLGAIAVATEARSAHGPGRLCG